MVLVGIAEDPEPVLLSGYYINNELSARECTRTIHSRTSVHTFSCPTGQQTGTNNA